jgi:hypothetical protein
VRRWAPIALGLALATACGGSGTPPATTAPKAKPAVELHAGPLSDYVAAAGLRWMLVGNPRVIAEDSGLAESIELILPGKRLDAFTKSSGVDLRKADAALAAGFDFGNLYMVQAPGSVKAVQARFTERLISGAVVKRPHPDLDWVSGVVGTTPETLVRVDDRFAAVAVGSPTPARVVELFALGKLKRSPKAFLGSALKSLPVDELERAPARFYAPGPFEGEWLRAARGLLQTATALGVAAQPAGGGRIQFTVFIAGDFSDPKGDPATRLENAWNEVAQSGIGRLLAFNEPTSGPSISGTPDLLRLEVELAAKPLATGLRAAVMAEVWEIFDLQPKKP